MEQWPHDMADPVPPSQQRGEGSRGANFAGVPPAAGGAPPGRLAADDWDSSTGGWATSLTQGAPQDLQSCTGCPLLAGAACQSPQS